MQPIKSKILIVILLMSLCCIFLIILTPPVYKLKEDFLHYQVYDENKNRYPRTIGPKHQDWIRLENIENQCIDMIVIAEDAHFYEHHGFNMAAKYYAIKNMLLDLYVKKQTVTWGASTITEQIVKNAFLTREKTLMRKAKQSLGAVWLDRILTKDEQLEWYVNLAEFGPKIYGIKNAAQFLFDKNLDQLDSLDCAFLASILPSPVLHATRFKNNIIERDILARMRQILVLYALTLSREEAMAFLPLVSSPMFLR